MGYWNEKKKYEEEKNQANLSIPKGFVAIVNCLWCGNLLNFDKKNNRYKWIVCQGKLHWFNKGLILCDSCAKKCKKCNRFFCPKHIEKHRCI